MMTTTLRLILGTSALTASLFAATGTAGAGTAATALPVVGCNAATGDGAPSTITPIVGGRVAGIYQNRVTQVVKLSDPKLVYWSKVALFVREGTEPFTIRVVPSQRSIAAMNWGQQMQSYASGVRVVPCPKGETSENWVWFAGGYYVKTPMCVHLVVDLGKHQAYTRVPVGKRC